MTNAEIDISPALGEGLSPEQLGQALAAVWQKGMTTVLASKRSGHQMAERLSELMDGIVSNACRDLLPGGCAVAAVGGYGEGRLAPYSDVDLLLLAPSEESAGAAMPVLHVLWDAGINLSQFVHTPMSAMAACRDDVLARTSFLDARLICGDQSVYSSFRDRFSRLTRETADEYIRVKLAEREERHRQAAYSTYAIEPNVKEGRGALRDIQTLHWLDRYTAINDMPPMQLLATPDLLSAKEARRLGQLNDFLWSVRVHLHHLRGRSDNTLHFALQDHVAEAMNFRSSGATSRVERFMRYYFLVTQEVQRLTRAASDSIRGRLQTRAAAVPAMPVTDYPRLCRVGDHLAFSADVEVPDGRDTLDIFHAMGTTGVPVGPDAFNAIARAARRLHFRILRAPQLRRRFAAIITDSMELEPVLRVMSETGFLGRMLPTFGAIVGKAEYGLFKQFTLEDHCLRSVAVLDTLVAGREPEFAGLPFIGEARKLRAGLAMALLLQEIWSAIPNPTSARVSRRIEVRVGFLFDDPELAELVAFAVVKRSLLGKIATRRNVVDPRTLASVAGEIGTMEHLKFLSLFTLCRQRVAGIGSWDEYSHRNIKLLVELIALQIMSGSEAVEARLSDESRDRRDRIAAAVGEGRMAQFDSLLDEAGPSFWAFTDDRAATRLARVMADADHFGRDGAAATETDQDGLLHVVVYTDDRPALLTACTGLAAMAGASVFSASGFSFGTGARRRGVVMLQLNRAGTPPAPFGQDAAEVAELTQQFQLVAEGKELPIREPSAPVGDRREIFDVTPRIRINEDASDEALIVEVEVRDRPGLLYTLSKSLSDVGVDLLFTLVATYGHRAVDTFYLKDHPGYKIEDPRRIETIRRQLVRALGIPVADGDESIEIKAPPLD